MLLSKIALGIAALPFAIGGTAGIVHTSKYPEPRSQVSNRSELYSALESNDYHAWQEVVTSNTKHPFAAHADEEVFAALREIHLLYQAGEKQAAHRAHKELMETLGIERPQLVHKHKEQHKFGH